MFQLFLLLILGVDWASGYAIAGYCMSHGVSPYGYAFWQSFGPMILLLLVQLPSIKKIKVKINSVFIKYVMLSGLCGIVIPNLLMYIAVERVPSGLLTILSNTAPLLVYILALLYREERFHLIRSISILTGLVGVIMILGVGLQLNANIGGIWLLAALLIPFSYAFCAVYVAKFRPAHGNSLNYACGMLIVATLCNIPIVYLSHGFYSLHLNDFNSYLIILEILLSGCGYVLLFAIIRMVGSVYYTLVNIITALTGMIYGYFIFNQRYPDNIYIAIIIVLIAMSGLIITQRNTRNKHKI
jgi:drug/metabolite transporter (DMT)-like permease